jgi:hypothetical protein
MPQTSARLVIGTAVVVALCPGIAAADLTVPIGYLELHAERPPTLSNLDPLPEDEGLAGARVGLSDNATTGGFLGHEYVLTETVVPPGEDWLAAAADALAVTPILVVNAPAEALLALADLPEAEGALVFNAGAEDVALREGDCRANVLHTIPSYDMRSDALAQFMLHKRWTDWAMIRGTDPRDEAFAAALAPFGKVLPPCIPSPAAPAAPCAPAVPTRAREASSCDGRARRRHLRALQPCLAPQICAPSTGAGPVTMPAGPTPWAIGRGPRRHQRDRPRTAGAPRLPPCGRCCTRARGSRER